MSFTIKIDSLKSVVIAIYNPGQEGIHPLD